MSHLIVATALASSSEASSLVPGETCDAVQAALVSCKWVCVLYSVGFFFKDSLVSFRKSFFSQQQQQHDGEHRLARRFLVFLRCGENEKEVDGDGKKGYGYLIWFVLFVFSGMALVLLLAHVDS